MKFDQYTVDVYLQDSYFAPNNQNCPISVEQWQLWFNVWFNSLELDLDLDCNYDFSLVLTNDAEIQQLNHQFRHQNRATDVLAFAALETDFPPTDLFDAVPLGDVIISVDTAKRQAEKQKHSLSVELAWLAVHGFLHLLGWDHPDNQSLAKMLEQQRLLLKKVSIML